MASPVLDFGSDARLRTIPEDRIIDSIAFRAWPRADRLRDPEGVRRTLRDALARWRALGLPYALDAQGRRRYDLTEVSVLLRYAGWKGHDDFWRDQHLVASRAQVLSFHPPGTPRDRAPDPRALPPRRITVSLERRFEPAWVVPNARLRIPTPMADGALRELASAFEPVEGARGELRVADGYAECRLATAPATPVTLRARYTFVGSPSPAADAFAPLGAAERAEYLRPREDMVRVTPSGESIARAVTAGAANPAERVRRLYDYVAGRRCGDEFPYATLDLPLPAGPRQLGFYDCQAMAALFVALCRAAGIPARRVGGYLIYPDAVGFHHWAETWIEGSGWMPVDSLTGETSAVFRDASWIPFFGAIDYRMKTGIVPRVFTGSPGVRMPAHWTMLERDADGGTCTEVVDAVTLHPVWTDTFRVELHPPCLPS